LSWGLDLALNRGGQRLAFIYTEGKMIDLGTLGGGHRSAPGIKNSWLNMDCSKDYAFLYAGGNDELSR
jgi:hypothetical protein